MVALEAARQWLDGAAALRAPCASCGAEGENWVCLSCHATHCSRYVRGHAADHAAASGHHLACSLSDLSFWDFGQDCYLDVFAIDALHAPYSALHLAKFGEAPALPKRGAARSAGPAFTLEVVPPSAADGGGEEETKGS